MTRELLGDADVGPHVEQVTDEGPPHVVRGERSVGKWALKYLRATTGTAIYWDRDKKVDGRWPIEDTKCERIYELNEHKREDPKFDYHYLAKYGRRPNE